MNQKITLYHGSEQLVETPTFGFGKKNNDFGLGFYCTGSEELAKEWAVSSLRNGLLIKQAIITIVSSAILIFPYSIGFSSKSSIEHPITRDSL